MAISIAIIAAGFLYNTIQNTSFDCDTALFKAFHTSTINSFRRIDFKPSDKKSRTCISANNSRIGHGQNRWRVNNYQIIFIAYFFSKGFKSWMH